jgi:hypothetical protein
VGGRVALARADLREGDLIAATEDVVRLDPMDVPARGPNPLREHAQDERLGKGQEEAAVVLLLLFPLNGEGVLLNLADGERAKLLQQPVDAGIAGCQPFSLPRLHPRRVEIQRNDQLRHGSVAPRVDLLHLREVGADPLQVGSEQGRGVG